MSGLFPPVKWCLKSGHFDRVKLRSKFGPLVGKADPPLSGQPDPPLSGQFGPLKLFLPRRVMVIENGEQPSVLP